MAPTSPPEPFTLGTMPTPPGPLLLVTDAAGHLRALEWADHESRMLDLLRRHHGGVALRAGPPPAPVERALEDYFAGTLDAVGSITVTADGTAFQKRVWRALRDIPPGQTRSYAALAAAIGQPAAVRAVGRANAANPVSIVVPCHRVIGADGSLTGYSGGVARKAWLLRHEGISPAPADRIAGADPDDMPSSDRPKRLETIMK